MDIYVFNNFFNYTYYSGDIMKSLKYLALILVLFTISKQVYAHTFDNTIKVYDYAQVLTEKEQSKIKEQVKEYIEKSNIDMAVVFVKYYSYDNLDKYVNEFYTKNNFGIGDDKSGIIMALDVRNNKVSINTYGEAKDLYSEEEVKNMVASISKTNKNYKKTENFIKYSNEYLNTDIKISTSEKVLRKINFIIVIIPSLLISTLVALMLFLKTRKKEENIDISNLYIDKNSVVINEEEDKFIDTRTKQVNG